MVVARDWGEEGMDSCCLMGVVSGFQDETFLEICFTTV